MKQMHWPVFPHSHHSLLDSWLENVLFNRCKIIYVRNFFNCTYYKHDLANNLFYFGSLLRSHWQETLMTVSVQMKPLQQFHMVPFVFLVFDKKKRKKKKRKSTWSDHTVQMEVKDCLLIKVPIGHLHDDVILLLRPESFRVLLLV